MASFLIPKIGHRSSFSVISFTKLEIRICVVSIVLAAIIALLLPFAPTVYNPS